MEGEPFRRSEDGLPRGEGKGPRQGHPAEMVSAASRARVSGGRAEGGTGAGAREERRLKGPLLSRDALSPIPSKLLSASPGYGSSAAALPALLAALQGLRRALRHAACSAAAAASDRHPGRSPARSVGCRRVGGRIGVRWCRCPAAETRERGALYTRENPPGCWRGSLSDGPSTLPTIPDLAAGSDAARPPAREGISP